MNIHKITEYCGTYRSVSFSAKHNVFWWAKDNPHWTYYITIGLNRLPDRVNPESFWLTETNEDGYYSCHRIPIIGDIYFHGRLTFYLKEDRGLRCVTLGCDYNHIWDRNDITGNLFEYSFDYVFADVKKTIDSFLDLVPEYEKLEGEG